MMSCNLVQAFAQSLVKKRKGQKKAEFSKKATGNAFNTLRRHCVRARLGQIQHWNVEHRLASYETVEPGMPC